MPTPSYDTWKTTTPEDKLITVCECEYCNAELYAGQEVAIDTEENLYFCDRDCFNEFQQESRMSKIELPGGYN